MTKIEVYTLLKHRNGTIKEARVLDRELQFYCITTWMQINFQNSTLVCHKQEDSGEHINMIKITISLQIKGF
jgi:hypothetical protein